MSKIVIMLKEQHILLGMLRHVITVIYRLVLYMYLVPSEQTRRVPSICLHCCRTVYIRCKQWL